MARGDMKAGSAEKESEAEKTPAHGGAESCARTRDRGIVLRPRFFYTSISNILAWVLRKSMNLRSGAESREAVGKSMY